MKFQEKLFDSSQAISYIQKNGLILNFNTSSAQEQTCPTKLIIAIIALMFIPSSSQKIRICSEVTSPVFQTFFL
jgi:hypothetical protein